ncbi:MAG: YbaK/EbsC family protein [Actinobacteria bacterium]|nr:MAG: YbaK/EbsC family protein [Actinomycetota bacterium]
MGGERTAEGKRRAGSAERVRAWLDERGWADRLTVFDDPAQTKTAAAAAEAMGCELGQIAKSLVFTARDAPVLVLVAGDRRGDAAAIAAECGAAGEAVFSGRELVREATGYSIGGVCPFDLPGGLAVLVDEALGRYETLFPAGGTPNSMVRVSLAELLDVTGGRVARVSHES